MDLRTSVQSTFIVSFPSDEAMRFQKKCRLQKKPLEMVPRLKRAWGHSFGAFGLKGLYIIMQNLLCKNVVELLV